MLILAPMFILALVFGVWMSLRYSLAMPASVVEELPAGQAIKRSIELSKDSRGRILALGALTYAIRLLLGILLGFPFLVFAVKHPGQPVPIALLAIQQIATFIVNTFIGPIYSAGLTLFYYDQRIRKEGYDIERMMLAAGLTLPAELPAPEQS
jgi:membrane-anchored glycerophosphoryl diester phosphodiesterase (GDPDase)